jgi:hypothetical protein
MITQVGYLIDPQNHWDGLSEVWLRNHWDGFLRFDLKTSSDGFLVEPQNQGGGGFSGLDLKIDSYDLVIWALKSLRRFLVLDLKIKQATVCRLRHETNGRTTTWDTRRDLAACFAWK